MALLEVSGSPSSRIRGRRDRCEYRRTTRSSWHPGTCFSFRVASPTPPGRSVHLTIGLRSETGIDLLGYMHKKAAQDALLRMNLPRQVVDEQSEAHEAAL
jgi:hypothetical protein